MELLNDKRPDLAKAFLEDWPITIGAPKILQLLFETTGEPKRKKPSVISIECYAISIIQDMKDNYIRGKILHFDSSNVLYPRVLF